MCDLNQWFLSTSFADGVPIKVLISQSTISIHSDIGRLRHFHHFGNVLNLAMCSVDNPKISLWEGRIIARYIQTC